MSESNAARAQSASSATESFDCLWESCTKSFPDPEGLYNHLCAEHVGRKSTNNLCLTCHWKDCGTTCAKRDHITSHLRGLPVFTWHPPIVFDPPPPIQFIRHLNPICVKFVANPLSVRKTSRNMRKYTPKPITSNINIPKRSPSRTIPGRPRRMTPPTLAVPLRR